MENVAGLQRIATINFKSHSLMTQQAQANFKDSTKMPPIAYMDHFRPHGPICQGWLVTTLYIEQLQMHHLRMQDAEGGNICLPYSHIGK